MRAFVTCDGEPGQIEVFQEPELLEAFKAALIDFGKTPASCSGICQASDVSNFFKASKKRVKTLYSDNFVDAEVEEDIMAMLTEMNFSSEKKRLVCDALQLVARAVQDTLTRSCVQHGYERCGQYPVNFDKAMAKVPLSAKKTLVGWYLEDKASQNTKLTDFATIRGICPSTFSDWVQKEIMLRETGVNNFHSDTGRPHIFSVPVTKSITETTVDKSLEQKTPNDKEFLEICVSAIEEDLVGRNGKAEVANPPSRSTIKRLQHEIQAYRKVVQKKTPARIVAEADAK